MELGAGLLLLAGLFLLLLGLAVVIGIVVVLFKVGVIGHYALKEEEPDPGSYSLDQSRETDRP